MWIKKLLTSLALLSVFLTAPSQAAELELNGVAVYSHLTREYYLGGLYLPKRSDDPKYIRSDAINKRMQLVVRVSSWSPRRWTDIWQNNLAINNDDLDPSPQMQDALIKFTSFLRSDLKQGDQLDVLYQSNGNSRVLLNGDLVLEVPGVDFFNYMVNTWIGKLPPTREFRQQILGQENQNEQFRAALLGHKATRPGLYAGWLNAEKAAAQAAARAADAEREQARQAKLEQQRQQEQAKARSEDRQQEEEERQARLAAEKLAKERAEQQRKQQELAIKAQAEKLAREGNQNAAKTLADEQRYYLQMLQWQIQRQVESAVLYPAWAKQFNQEGLVELDFHINRKQEISKMQVRNDSISNLLTNEVQRAASAAVSKVNLPPQLAGDNWPISVRYQFSLKGSTQNDTAMPSAPSSLTKAGGNDALKQQEQDYRNEQSARILSQVQYPPGARVLKKQDKVKIEVLLNAEGSVSAVREVSASKHREFNQAMHAAVKAAEPFPPIPVGLKDLTLSIEHEFKL